MPNFAPHLHTETCNRLLQQLLDCHRNNPVKRYFMACNHEHALVDKCLYLERERNRKANHEKAKLRNKRTVGVKEKTNE